MSKTKFTPGPWSVKTYGWDGRHLVHSGTHWLADLTMFYDTAEANARLIAAAPDLYEALDRLLKGGFGSEEEYQNLIKDCEDALAKARGELTQAAEV